MTASASAAACPNEATPGFRAYLPSCGAYELVSPSFKDGVETDSIGLGISPDGSRQMISSPGTFGGAEGNVLGADYLLTRTSTGWLTGSVTPPAAQFPAFQFMAVDPAIDRTLWALRGPSESIYAKTLYLRDGAGAFHEVGSMVPPSATGGPPAGAFAVLSGRYSFAGASSDLSHVLFSTLHEPGDAPGALWPGDTTAESPSGGGGNSLYEYVGTGSSRPSLVGVSDGSSVVNGQVLPQGQLLSSCSTILGSEGRTDVYNAVSSDGEVVYFTARGHSNPECVNPAAPEVSELYARVGGFETVPISEPTARQCEQCKTTVRAPAAFGGASQDGSKVFFMSEQELLPGASGPNLYEYDFGRSAAEKVLRVSSGSSAPEVQGVARVSQDGSHVYFVAKGVLTTGPNGRGGEPTAGAENLYLFERDAAFPGGHLVFIATLLGRDEETGEPRDEADWNSEEGDRRPVQATADGRFLVFQSVVDLTPGDTSKQPQIFEFDSATEELVRVSVGQQGYPAGAESADANASQIRKQDYAAAAGFRPAQANSSLALSADGHKVVFASAGALAPEAVESAAAGIESIYEYRSAGPIASGGVHLISDGKNQARGEETGAYTDQAGVDVFFQSIDQLVPQDGDTQFDLYDARDGGGFPAPAPAPACLAEACQGPASAIPGFSLPASAGTPGEPAAPVSSPTPVAPTPKVPAVTRTQKLANALRACARHRGRRRSSCVRRAKNRYGIHAHGRPGRKK
jgi:hypothetical protein